MSVRASRAPMNKCKSEDMGSGAWKSEPSIVASMPGNAGAALRVAV